MGSASRSSRGLKCFDVDAKHSRPISRAPMTSVVCLTQTQFSRLMLHLIPRRQKVEQLAFLFVKPQQSCGVLRLVCEDSWYCAPDEFAAQSAYHIALKDETKASLIKKAHDTGCALVE